MHFVFSLLLLEAIVYKYQSIFINLQITTQLFSQKKEASMGTFVWLTQILICIMLFLLNFQSNSSLLVSSNSSSSTTFLCHQDESLALLHFKNSFIIDKSLSGYPKTESWKEGTDC